jgi:putative sterol carrier protein
VQDTSAEFFAALAERGEEPLLQKSSGTLRFDLVHGKKTDHWLVTITRGRMQATRERGEADCAIRTDKELFDRIVQGEVNAMSAFLRGSAMLTAKGPRELELLMLFQRLFPPPPDGWRAERLVPAAGGR